MNLPAYNTKALITGITGQDGSYLAELLLKKDYNVIGMIRHTSSRRFKNILHLLNDDNPGFDIISGDMTDAISLRRVIEKVKPDEVYNLAAMSFVAESWDQPVLTNEVNYIGFLNLLEACRDMVKRPRVYQASTSEMFGNVPAPQNENSPMLPRSPYGVSKLAAHRMARVFRESFDMFVACGILFNHESPRRGYEFVTRKISSTVAGIYLGKEMELILGDMSARRDWGYAPDYVEAMWLMLQQSEPDDFVIGTGVNYSVEDFVRIAFNYIGLDWKEHVRQDEELMRPAEVYDLRADATKAANTLAWTNPTPIIELVNKMVEADIQLWGQREIG